MKDFIKMTLAAIVGFVIVNAISLIFIIGLAGTIASFGSSQPVMPRSAVLKIDLGTTAIGEQSKPVNPLNAIQGNYVSTVGILDACRAILTAAEDPDIQYIYMKPDMAVGGMAEIEELREALKKFRSSGKAVISYIENPTNAGYYLASASDKIYMTPHIGGMNFMGGISSQMIFLKDILDRLGVNVQLIRHGKFKSAGEMFTKTESSQDNMLQNKELLNSIWASWTGEIAQSRNISEEDFNSYLDNLELVRPEDFTEKGLVDELLSQDGLKAKIASFAGVESFEEVGMVSLADYVTLRVMPNYKVSEKIAVIYATGNIVDGIDDSQVAGDRFAGIVSAVRKDKDVKGVVLRVNSPGGSVLASEKIRNELMLLAEEKPLVTSFGDYAASGGYWISTCSDRIFTNSSTITGSIGVFSIIPDFSKTLKDVAHINITTVNTNRHSDLYSGLRPLSAEEKAYMQASVEDVYERFTTIVSEGRSIEKEYVDSIGQGRVWSGVDAIRLKLADTEGSLVDALEYAALCASEDNSADMSKWQIVEYPKPLTTLETLMQTFGTASASVFKGTPLESVEKTFRSWDASESGKVYARLPYELIIK